MVKNSTLRKALMLSALVLAVMSVCAPFAMAAEAAEGASQAGNTSIGEGIRVAGIALAAGLALAGAALGTGRAQASIGAGGTGALAEKPELFINVLILVALPETIVVLGFVIGFLILGKI
jgi:V/A-type H+/Na+-transporting ATPase subunit K